MTYLIRFNPDTMKSSVHVEGCSCAYGRTRGHTSAIEARSIGVAVAAYRAGEDADARRLPRTTVAKCAKPAANAVGAMLERAFFDPAEAQFRRRNPNRSQEP